MRVSLKRQMCRIPAEREPGLGSLGRTSHSEGTGKHQKKMYRLWAASEEQMAVGPTFIV